MKEPREIVTLTPEEKAYFRAMCPLVLTRGGNFRIEINPAMPKDTVALFSPRRRTVTYDATGNELSSVWEPEEEWLKRCAVITNVKVPE